MLGKLRTFLAVEETKSRSKNRISYNCKISVDVPVEFEVDAVVVQFLLLYARGVELEDGCLDHSVEILGYVEQSHHVLRPKVHYETTTHHTT